MTRELHSASIVHLAVAVTAMFTAVGMSTVASAADAKSDAGKRDAADALSGLDVERVKLAHRTLVLAVQVRDQPVIVAESAGDRHPHPRSRESCDFFYGDFCAGHSVCRSCYAMKEGCQVSADR